MSLGCPRLISSSPILRFLLARSPSLTHTNKSSRETQMATTQWTIYTRQSYQTRHEFCTYREGPPQVQNMLLNVSFMRPTYFIRSLMASVWEQKAEEKTRRSNSMLCPTSGDLLKKQRVWYATDWKSPLHQLFTMLLRLFVPTISAANFSGWIKSVLIKVIRRRRQFKSNIYCRSIS